MRIVLDLQGAQTESRFHAIGRSALALALAIVREASGHEIWLGLNAQFATAALDVQHAFFGLIPPDRMQAFAVAGPVAESNPTNTWRSRAAELVREAWFANLTPDIVHISSLFEGWIDDAVTSVGSFTDGKHAAVTLHDLAPLIEPATYLSNAKHQDWYYRKLQSLRQSGLLLAVSEYARTEAIAAGAIPPERVITIFSAANERFRPLVLSDEERTEIRARLGLAREVVLYCPGSFDGRKNVGGLIAAYGLLPPELRQTHQLVLASKIQPSERASVERTARAAGLASDEVVITDYLNDDDLIRLYNLARLFVFPSKYEGFGLPVLEAMACGAPTIGSNRTSVPEIIGRPEALFDPLAPSSMAMLIVRALTDDGFRESLRARGLQQAAKFSWKASAKRALSAFEEQMERSAHSVTTRPGPFLSHPLLAFVSPLPPLNTGIADYSATLLPELARYYRVELITDQGHIDDPVLSVNFPVRTVAWFADHAERYDRILYQFGNSAFHAHMPALLRRFPGTVVLHDFFLSGCFRDSEEQGLMPPGSFAQALYDAHGYPALVALAKSGKDQTTLNWPVSLAAIGSAVGVIVHSNYARQQATLWYGTACAAHWAKIPSLARRLILPEKADARRHLALPENALIICSFGQIHESKLNDRLIQTWLASGLSRNRHNLLVFVGRPAGGAYRQRLDKIIKDSGVQDRIRFTRNVSPETYTLWLAAADLAIQLRSRSRGETSAAILDVLAAGLPLVFNAHGPAAEIPEAVAIKLTDSFGDADLSRAMTALAVDPDRRRTLGEAARSYVRGAHAPALCAKLYRDAIEDFTANHPISRQRMLMDRLSCDPTFSAASVSDLAETATATSKNTPAVRPRRLWVDVSDVVKQDLRTGIQRAARAWLTGLLASPPAGFQVEPVYLTVHGQRWIYRRACSFTQRLLDLAPERGFADEVALLRSGDYLLVLDLFPAGVIAAEAQGMYRSLRAEGVEVTFVVYDLLPIRKPDWFPPGASQTHQAWTTAVCRSATRIACISHAVAEDVCTFLATNGPERHAPPKIEVVHLGADVRASVPTCGLPNDAPTLLALLASRPSFLMVGTVEPRKGLLQTLAAFELLWTITVDINLVIVGKEGWRDLPQVQRRTIPVIAARLRRHGELGRRLFWLEGSSDEYLEQIYGACTCLIAASENEGFGLPLIEAARHKLPIMARDIDVFREVAGDHASYFRGDKPEDLAYAVRDWLALFAAGRHPKSDEMPWLTWAQSTARLKGVIATGNGVENCRGDSV